MRIVNKFETTGKFSVEVFNLKQADCAEWVQFVSDPKRFIPEIFEGLWAKTTSHPNPGALRVIRVIKGKDGITRVIGRQENRIFANPWI